MCVLFVCVVCCVCVVCVLCVLCVCVYIHQQISFTCTIRCDRYLYVAAPTCDLRPPKWGPTIFDPLL